jgi:tetratricopeptide (TPR) repeat protein
MSNVSPPARPDEAFKRGLACLERKTYQEASGYFQKALDMEKESQGGTSMKYLSFLGLALVLSQGRSDEGLKMCEQAVKRDFFDPDLFCNLGIALLRHRQRGPAFAAFKRGLTLRPRYRRIVDELERYERRAEPVFGFLARQHPINVTAGRMRSRLREFLARFAPTEA